MFKVNATPEFTHTVTVMVPTDGGHEEQSFKARFRVLTTDVEAKLEVGNREYLHKILVSMEDLVDEAGKPVSYNDAVRDQMLALPYVSVALVNAYVNALVKERSGN
jgi:hypothetical protein